MTSEAHAILQQQLLAALNNVPTETRRLLHGRLLEWPGMEQITVDWMQGL
ncbi:class I SAM-dependent methyltransferase, partial [Pseudomonas syringae pv. tagetis]